MEILRKSEIVGPEENSIAGVATGLGTTNTEYVHPSGMVVRTRDGRDVVIATDIVKQILARAGLQAPTTPRVDRKVFGLEEAAEMLDISKRFAEYERDAGRLRCFRLGNRWKVSSDELNAYIRKREKEG